MARHGARDAAIFTATAGGRDSRLSWYDLLQRSDEVAAGLLALGIRRGNRVGIWRMLELADQLEIPLAHQINSYLYETHPRIMAALGKRPRDEIVGHGRTNAERQGVLGEADERALIAEATANARKSAEQFAKDSGARLAGIRSANQGVVSISDRDRGSPQVKTVRVVTTVEYFLKD